MSDYPNVAEMTESIFDGIATEQERVSEVMTSLLEDIAKIPVEDGNVEQLTAGCNAAAMTNIAGELRMVNAHLEALVRLKALELGEES